MTRETLIAKKPGFWLRIAKLGQRTETGFLVCDKKPGFCLYGSVMEEEQNENETIDFD